MASLSLCEFAHSTLSCITYQLQSKLFFCSIIIESKWKTCKHNFPVMLLQFNLQSANQKACDNRPIRIIKWILSTANQRAGSNHGLNLLGNQRVLSILYIQYCLWFTSDSELACFDCPKNIRLTLTYFVGKTFKYNDLFLLMCNLLKCTQHKDVEKEIYIRNAQCNPF